MGQGILILMKTNEVHEKKAAENKGEEERRKEAIYS